MKRNFEHKHTHKEEVKASEKSDHDKRHDKLKNGALMDYYMMGGY